ncbi:MAG: hypothetical protein GVY20_11755 [Bacteroidetes bacterium]|jgi:hypothetical protein|nr:hypothetical protein [Bacteroidota bacterium]
MKLIKPIYRYCTLLLIAYSITACSSTNVNGNDDIFRDQSGTLRWGGAPAVDGVGMLFIDNEIEYGAPGTPDDYPELFEEDIYEVEVRADFKLTGEETIRGWGATFPAIEFIKIEKL